MSQIASGNSAGSLRMGVWAHRREVLTVTRGAHGHEKVGEEMLRVRCYNCGHRVMFEPGQDEVKCPHCETMVKRPKQK